MLDATSKSSFWLILCSTSDMHPRETSRTLEGFKLSGLNHVLTGPLVVTAHAHTLYRASVCVRVLDGRPYLLCVPCAALTLFRL